MAVKAKLRGFDHDDVLAESAVHYGFRHALDAIWSDNTNTYKSAHRKPDQTLVEYLEQFRGSGKRLWLTGHSLGGALATIAAARIALSPQQESAKNIVGTDNALNMEIAGLITIGSPRVLADKPAELLEKKLGDNKIFRIHKSIDPVPLVPSWGYDHVSGRRCYVTREGMLVIDVTKTNKYLDRFYSWVRGIEDAIGTVVPGQHIGMKRLVADHNSEEYLRSVRDWKASNRARFKSLLLPILVSVIKTAGPLSAVITASIYGLLKLPGIG